MITTYVWVSEVTASMFKCAVVAVILGLGVCARAEDSPRDVLAAQWKTLQSVKNLQADFTCEKQIAALEQPLVSVGAVTIGGADQLRFSTQRPYVSEVILDHGTVLLKSQHETTWTRATEAGRPGLSTIMKQVAGWTLGDMSKLDETYKISSDTSAIPNRPEGDAATEPAAHKVESQVMFILTPIKPEMAKAVQSLKLATDPATHQLTFLEVTTPDQNVTRYWFYNTRTNVLLPPDVFTPGGVKHE